MRRIPSLFAVVVLVGAFAVAGCSSDTTDKAKDTAKSAQEDVEDAAGTGAARIAAEGLRASLKGNATADDEGVRSVKAINDAADELPDDAELSGVDDGDGDGKDDDGKVQVSVGDQQACLTLPATGEDTKVTTGPC
jgi:hypothetical protein